MDAASYLALLRRRMLVIIACVVAGIAGAISATRSSPERYESSVRLFVNIPAARGVQEALQGVQLSSQLLQSYAVLATSRTAAAEVASTLNLPGGSHAVQQSLSAAATPETLILTITARHNEPRTAQRIANTAASVFIGTIEELETGREDAIAPRVIDFAPVPSSPVEPRPRRNLLVGTALGVLVGLGLAALLESLDRSIRSPGEAADLLRAPLLALLPRRRDAPAHPLLTPDDTGTTAAEAFRVLRTALRFVDLDRPLKSIIITSPMPGEGKSVTVANVAVALAQAGERVILVDADLRRSRLPELFGVKEAELGLTTVVFGRSDLDDSLVRVSDRLLLLPPGPLPPNPSEILGSTAMTHLVAELGRRADVVLFDTPPVLPVTDAQVLSTQVDGVVVVAKYGRTRRDLAEEARRRLEVVDAHIVGAVLNGVPPSADYSEEYRYTAYAPRQSKMRRLINR